MSSINFDNVYLLFIAVPVAILFLIPFFIAVGKDNRNIHNVLSAILHVLLAIVIAFAVAGTSIVTVVTETDVYVVADVSYSANKNLDTIDEYIGELKKGLPQNSYMGVVCFGKDQELLTDLGENLRSVKDNKVDTSATDIVAALKYAGSLYKEDVIKRMVVITDGKDSDTRDPNALKRAVEELRNANIYVDAIYLDDNIKNTVNEVQISSAEFTHTAYLKCEESVNLTIQASKRADAIVKLYKNGESFAEKAVTLTEGTNHVSFDLDTSLSGTFEYEAVVESNADESSFNNAYRFDQIVSGSVNVLLISDKASDKGLVEKMYGDSAVVTSYINKPNIPYGVEELCEYDEIVLSNVDVSKLNNVSTFIQNLDTVVSKFGKSLITLGDDCIQNRSDDTLKQLEDMLPVRFGNNEQDPKLYTLVIDTSRSMEFLYHLTVAKQAATNLINLMNEEDYLCIVSFYGDVRIIQAPTKASIANRNEILKKIDDLYVTQGTYIGLGLSQAYNLMVNSSFSEKQIMLISDGLTYTQEKDNPLSVVRQMRANNITVSVLDVGRGADDGSSAMAGEQLLKNIAVEGGGKYYLAKTPAELAEVMFGQIAEDVTETIVDRNSWVNVNRRFDKVLEEVDLNNAFISGFVNSSAKASATTVLTVDYEKPNGATVAVPLYAYWDYGNGKVASFTSYLAENCFKTRDGELDATNFFTNLFASNTPSEKIDHPYNVDVTKTEKTTRIEVTPAMIHVDSVANVKIVLPEGDTIEEKMKFDSSYYYFDFELSDVGRYEITISYSYGGTEYEADASFVISYLPEYNSFAAFDASPLYKMIGGEGTVSEDGKLTIENNENEIGVYIIELAVPLLAIAVALYVIDIIVRKIKWADIVGLFKKIK